MSDAELRAFEKTERGSLTLEALDILKAEFSARRISVNIFEDSEVNRQLEETANLKKIMRSVADTTSTTMISMALTEKRDGESDDVIIYHLMEQGLDEDQARLIITQLKPEAQERLKKANATILTSVFIIFAGIALKLISPQKNFVTFLDIASNCTIIFGSFRLLKGYLDYSKFKTVIRNIQRYT